MIKINLLPKKPAKKMILYDLYLFLFVVILNLAIVGGIYYKNEKNIAEYKKVIGNAKAEIASLENIYREYLNLEKEKQEIEKRIKAINDVKEGRALAARTLYDLTSVIKENVWLKSFKKDEDRFELEGRAMENESIADFVENLSKIPYMRNVELINVEDIAEEGIVVKKFLVRGNIIL